MKPAEETARELLPCIGTPICCWRRADDHAASCPANHRQNVAAAIEAARREALEEASLIAQNEPEPQGEPPQYIEMFSAGTISRGAIRATKKSIAAAIRALLPAAPKPPGAA